MSGVLHVEFLRQLMIVDKYVALLDLHSLAGQADYAFDEGLLRIRGILENNDIASIRLPKSIDELVAQQSFTGHKVRRHAATIDLIALDNEGDKEKKDNCRHGKCLKKFAQGARKLLLQLCPSIKTSSN